MNGFIVRLKTEPTIFAQLAQVTLGLLVAFSVVGFTDVQTEAVLGIVAAVTGFLLALAVRPFSWAAITGLVQGAIVLLTAFGADLTDAQVGAVYTAVAVIGMFVRQFVVPETKLAPIVVTTGG